MTHSVAGLVTGTVISRTVDIQKALTGVGDLDYLNLSGAWHWKILFSQRIQVIGDRTGGFLGE